MKKSNRKKFTALCLVLAITVAMTFSGCGKEKVDYGFDGETQSGGNTEGTLAARLGIPESYEGNIATGDSGLSKITISDEDIQIPSVDGMSVVHYEKNPMDSEYKQKVAEAIFDRADGIYSFDWDNQYKEDIEIQMQIYQTLIDDATNSGDTGNAEWYEEYLNHLQKEYQDALDEREGPGDWSSLNYIGHIGMTQFRLDFSPSENGLSGYFSLNIHPYEGQILYRPHEGAVQAYYYLNYSDQEEEKANQCSWSEEEAVKRAQDFLNSCGITDVVMTQTMDIMWDYTDASYNTVATEVDGYIVDFSRSVDGVVPYNASLYMVDTLMSDNMFFFGYAFSNETFTIYIDDNGIFSLMCNDMIKPSGEIEKNVDLLSWNEVLEVANKVIPEYYTEHRTSYKSVEFNDVRLTYYLMDDEEEETYKYIPVWVFAQVEENEDDYEYDSPVQLIMIDAVTGELIDLQEKMSSGGSGGVIFDDLIDDDMFFQ